MINTPPYDDFVPPGVDAPSWLAFEARVQDRRYRSLLETVESCIVRGDIAGARLALEEARNLRPEAEEGARLEARLAGQRATVATVASRDSRVWRRVLAGSSMLLAGVSLLFIAESHPRSGGVQSSPLNPAPSGNSASAATAVPQNGTQATATRGSVPDLPATSDPRLNAATIPSARPVLPPQLSDLSTGTLAPQPRKPVALALRASRATRDVADASVSAPSPYAAPLITLGVTTATATEGSPVSLTVTLNIPAGAAAPRVTVDWGDGNTQDIGVVPTARTVTHSYTSAGAYNITATATPQAEPSATSQPASTLIVSREPAPVSADAPSLFRDAIGAVVRAAG